MLGNPKFTEPPEDLTGLWSFVGQHRTLDDILAIRKGHKNEDGAAAPHGTFTRVRYYRVVNYDAPVQPPPDDPPLHSLHKKLLEQLLEESKEKESKGFVSDGKINVLLIFDEDANFGHFVWNGIDAWEARREPVTFVVSAKAKNRFAPKDARLTRFPTLALTPYRETDFPRNGTDATRVSCPLSHGDPSVGSEDLPRQRITYDAESRTFKWEQPPERKLRLEFTKAEPQQTAKATEGRNESWGDTFKGQTLAQVTFPFVGFDPRNFDLYHLGKATSGTEPVTPPSNVGQQFGGTPIFAYPTLDSLDYVRSDLDHSPYLPLGCWGEKMEEAHEETHTQMISSVSERTGSWSLTLGLSGGIEGLLSASVEGSYSKKIEDQQKGEYRYSVSRKHGTTYRMFTDIPTLRLQEDFLREIQSRLKRYMAGETRKLDWKPFIDRFGTHYAHAITFGHIDVLETRYSLRAETKAWQQGLNLKTEAEATLFRLVKAGGKVAVDFEWGGKLGSEVSKEDVSHTGVGHATPMAIFFDLRPISELFSPLFFPYGPTKFTKDMMPIYANHIQAAAPFVWYDLRQSFEKHLARIGLNRPLDPSLQADYTPRIVKVTFTSWNLWVDDQDPCVYGDIKLESINGAVALEVKNVHVDKASMVELDDGADFYPRQDLSITLAVNRSRVESGAGFQITGCLWNQHISKPPDSALTIGPLFFSIRDGNRDAEWHSESGFGYKIAFELEDLLK